MMLEPASDGKAIFMIGKLPIYREIHSLILHLELGFIFCIDRVSLFKKVYPTNG